MKEYHILDMIKNISNKSDLIINNVYLVDTDNNVIDSSMISSYSFTIFTKNTPASSYQQLTDTQYDKITHTLYINAIQLSVLAQGQLYIRTSINVNDTNFHDKQNNISIDRALDYYLISDVDKSYDNVSSIINDMSARIQDNSINITDNLLKINRLTIDVDDVSSRFSNQQNQIDTNKIKIANNNDLINDVSSHLDSSYAALLHDVHNIVPKDLSINAYSKSEIDSSYNVLDTKIIDLSTNLIDLSTNIKSDYVKITQFDSSFNDLSTNINDNLLKINDLSSNLGTHISTEIADLSTAIKSDYVKITQFDSSFNNLLTNVYSKSQVDASYNVLDSKIIDVSTSVIYLTNNLFYIIQNYVKTSQFDTSFVDLSTNVYSKAYLDTSFDSLTAELGNINTILSSI